MLVERYIYETLRLSRWDVEVQVAREGTVQWLPIRPLCKVLGVDPQTQFATIHGRFHATERQVPFKTSAGWRDYLALPRSDIVLWIVGIDPARCGLKTRDRLDDFLADAKRELDKLLFNGDLVSPQAPERGKVEHSIAVEVRHSCLRCGAVHCVTVQNGESHVTLLAEQE